jgi:hypothetical protein
MNTGISLRVGLLFTLAVCVVGCASSAPHAKFASPGGPGMVVRAADTTSINVTTAAGVSMADWEKSRVTERVRSALAAKQALNQSPATPKQFDIDVTITRYEKGSAVARAFLAGLGQIHLDALVKVTDQATHVPVSEFKLEKTFAWGGIYGASTSMEDIELAFADGVASGLTGREGYAKTSSRKNSSEAAAR